MTTGISNSRTHYIPLEATTKFHEAPDLNDVEAQRGAKRKGGGTSPDLLARKFEAEVLPKSANDLLNNLRSGSITPATLDELERLTDVSRLDDTLKGLVLEQFERHTGVKDVPKALGEVIEVVEAFKRTDGTKTFDEVCEEKKLDPSALEKYVAVLMVLIWAASIAQQVAVQQQVHHSQMAYAGAECQSVAIAAEGRAAMSAAIGGAVIAFSFAAAGAAQSWKGQKAKAHDIDTNQRQVVKFEKTITTSNNDLNRGTKAVNVTSQTTVTTVDAQGNTTTLKTIDKPGAEMHQLSAEDRAVLNEVILKRKLQVRELNLTIALNEKGWRKSEIIGTALSAMAMVISTGISSVMRLQEYAQRQVQTLEQAGQTVEKSMSDTEAQRDQTLRSLIQKFFEIFQQVNQTHNEAVSVAASNIRA